MARSMSRSRNFSDAGAGSVHAVGVVKGKIGGSSHIGLPDAGVEQPQCGVHVADGAHGRACIAAQPGLIHNHRGGEVVDPFHLGLFVFGQSSPHKGGVGFVHLPLALGSDGVKYNAGFPGAGNPGKNHYFPLWDIQRDIFKIVLPKPTNDNYVLVHHTPPHFLPCIIHAPEAFFSTFFAKRTRCGQAVPFYKIIFIYNSQIIQGIVSVL